MKKLLLFEKKAKELILKNYHENYLVNYNKLIISNIMWNAKNHIISLFKDNLIFDELAEFFSEYIPKENSLKKLKYLLDYYTESSFIFPNYTPLPESKYIYKNIIKKQRVIDEQENLEEIKNKKKKLKDKHKNIFYDFYNNNNDSKFFNSTIYNSILKPSESLIKNLFGIGGKNTNDKNNSDYLNKNFIDNSNNDNKKENEQSLIEDYDIENIEEIYDNDKFNKEENEWDDEIDDIQKIY